MLGYADMGQEQVWSLFSVFHLRENKIGLSFIGRGKALYCKDLAITFLRVVFKQNKKQKKREKKKQVVNKIWGQPGNLLPKAHYKKPPAES